MALPSLQADRLSGIRLETPIAARVAFKTFFKAFYRTALPFRFSDNDRAIFRRYIN
jgi:hypothetical protein